jgi:chromosome partitioning protein
VSLAFWRLAAQFEVLVIDGPGARSEVTRAILLVAHLALLPCGPSVLDLRAVQEATTAGRTSPPRRAWPRSCPG